MSDLKEYKISMEHMMGGWFIDEGICNAILKYIDDNKHLSFKFLLRGQRAGTDENMVLRESTDWRIFPNEYHYPIKNYKDALHEVLLNYRNKYPDSNLVKKFGIFENINIQHYKPNQGFYPWHCENSGEKNNTRDRHLVFMTYLNDIDDGGTEFKFQKLKIPAKKGLTLIWPPTWTHMHRGVISKTSEKTIITGWFSFEPIS
jgi:hypothetical protein|tara:strand:- start:1534 stop:2139 length:606 start_codon:yes stop_codon:yes gene_type:complete